MTRLIEALQSEAVALRWVNALHPDAPTTLRYRAATRAAAAARQAVAFHASAQRAGLEVQPLLYYYALLDAIKVLLHLRDVHYPASTAVLQHGLSTRRSKRESYAWAHDVVYVYKSGVFQSCAALVSWQHPLPQRFVIGHLLGLLPWTRDAVAWFHEEYVHLYPAACHPHQPPRSPGAGMERGHNDTAWYISRSAAARRELTVEEWREAYATACREARHASDQAVAPVEVTTVGMGHSAAGDDAGVAPMGLRRTGEPSVAAEPAGFMRLPVSPIGHPWAIVHDGAVFVADDWPLPRWMIHMVLLYSLSTLCRYHPPEWSDILHWDNEIDAYLVRCYLSGVEDAWDVMDQMVRADSSRPIP